RPDMSAANGIDQLRVDPDTLGGAPCTPLKDVTHPHLASDLPDIDRLALIGKARITGDDEEPGNFGEVRNEVLGQAVGKIFLVRIVGHSGEWQDKNRWLGG